MEFDKNTTLTMSCEYENEHFSEDEFENESDWETFLKNCQSYDESDYEDCNFSEETEDLYFPKIPPGPVCEIGNVNYDMIVLGETFKQEKKKKSFKYSGINGQLFCSSFAKFDKKCTKPKCKYSHSFEDIPLCDSKCKRIEFENNYYTGNCNKKHKKETLVNFSFRKNIRLCSVKTGEFEFYERPSEDFIKSLLETAKKLKISTIDIKIVNRPTTIDDFFNCKSPEISDEETEEGLGSEDLKKIWGF